jgi:hypothetical protein
MPEPGSLPIQPVWGLVAKKVNPCHVCNGQSLYPCAGKCAHRRRRQFGRLSKRSAGSDGGLTHALRQEAHRCTQPPGRRTVQESLSRRIATWGDVSGNYPRREVLGYAGSSVVLVLTRDQGDHHREERRHPRFWQPGPMPALNRQPATRTSSHPPSTKGQNRVTALPRSANMRSPARPSCPAAAQASGGASVPLLGKVASAMFRCRLQVFHCRLRDNLSVAERSGNILSGALANGGFPSNIVRWGADASEDWRRPADSACAGPPVHRLCVQGWYVISRLSV